MKIMCVVRLSSVCSFYCILSHSTSNWQFLHPPGDGHFPLQAVPNTAVRSIPMHACSWCSHAGVCQGSMPMCGIAGQRVCIFSPSLDDVKQVLYQFTWPWVMHKGSCYGTFSTTFGTFSLLHFSQSSGYVEIFHCVQMFVSLINQLD